MAKKYRTPAEVKTALLAKKESIEAQRRKALAKVDSQLSAVEVREKIQARKDDTRLKIIMGGAVQAHAGIDPAFCSHLRAALVAAVIKDRDKELVQSWFDALTPTQQLPRPAN